MALVPRHVCFLPSLQVMVAHCTPHPVRSRVRATEIKSSLCHLRITTGVGLGDVPNHKLTCLQGSARTRVKRPVTVGVSKCAETLLYGIKSPFFQRSRLTARSACCLYRRHRFEFFIFLLSSKVKRASSVCIFAVQRSSAHAHSSTTAC